MKKRIAINSIIYGLVYFISAIAMEEREKQEEYLKKSPQKEEVLIVSVPSELYLRGLALFQVAKQLENKEQQFILLQEAEDKLNQVMIASLFFPETIADVEKLKKVIFAELCQLKQKILISNEEEAQVAFNKGCSLLNTAFEELSDVLGDQLRAQEIFCLAVFAYLDAYKKGCVHAYNYALIILIHLIHEIYKCLDGQGLCKEPPDLVREAWDRLIETCLNDDEKIDESKKEEVRKKISGKQGDCVK